MIIDICNIAFDIFLFVFLLLFYLLHRKRVNAEIKEYTKTQQAKQKFFEENSSLSKSLDNLVFLLSTQSEGSGFRFHLNVGELDEESDSLFPPDDICYCPHCDKFDDFEEEI
ncbi:MAG: hypothetical protein E7490_02885 [Ruminococcaceae bacterium]|nr:hypothetical protein [Oscillospiraceae bacterium]